MALVIRYSTLKIEEYRSTWFKKLLADACPPEINILMADDTKLTSRVERREVYSIEFVDLSRVTSFKKTCIESLFSSSKWKFLRIRARLCADLVFVIEMISNMARW